MFETRYINMFCFCHLIPATLTYKLSSGSPTRKARLLCTRLAWFPPPQYRSMISLASRTA